MSGFPPPLSVTDPTPVINAGEQRLGEYLAMPVHHVLDELGVQGFPTDGPAVQASPGSLAHSAGAINPIDPTQLISPVTSALGALGSGVPGLLSGLNPSASFNQISNAFDATSKSVQQAMSALGQGWLGASGTAAGHKTAAALANGADVSTQASGLGESLSAAAADVGQARTRLIAIINEFFATVAAVGPGIIFPPGWMAVLHAAAQAVAEATETLTEVQSSLAAHASTVWTIGAAITVEEAPQLGAAAASIATSLLPTLLGVATTGVGMTASMGVTAAMSAISPAMSAASKAASPAESTLANTGTLAGSTAAESALAAGRVAPSLHAANGATAGGGAATTPSAAPLPRLTAPTPPGPVTAAPSAPTRPATSSQSRSTTSSMPIEGAGMMPAPVAGAGLAGGAAGAGGAHTAASFLQTSDQGGKVVGNQTTVAPPVLGEADPSNTPDIELRL